jgi:hypothetical protein
MSNWFNLRLVATGNPEDLAPFRHDAGALEGRTKRTLPSGPLNPVC